MILPRDFYDRPTLDVARDLIGMRLVHETPAGRASGLIVETEAYIGESDPACHAAPGRTRRNAPLYGPPGIAYVYLNYGMHYLVNAVTEAADSPAAVLIRALVPDEGVALMQRRRARGTGKAASRFDEAGLCRGPGNLTKALGISLRQNGVDLCGTRMFVEEADGVASLSGVALASALAKTSEAPPRTADGWEIAWGPRIGINVGTERPWRCYLAGHPSVSGRAVRVSTAR